VTAHLNYCRQMVRQFVSESDLDSVAPWMKSFKAHCIDLARTSQKFILPDGGRLYDDPEYRALDESIPLMLPFERIAIEFTRSPNYISTQPIRNTAPGVFQTTKSLLFARQLDDCIAITVIIWSGTMWAPYPEVAIPLINYIDRSRRRNGYVSILLAQNDNAYMYVPASDYGDEVGALLGMLNVLRCGNVHIERSSSNVRKAMQAGKAFQFDDYHILTIDASGSAGSSSATTACHHRSPREHLRRGHIRRLADGRRIWVNATVVAAGKGAGFISKDYAVRPV